MAMDKELQTIASSAVSMRGNGFYNANAGIQERAMEKAVSFYSKYDSLSWLSLDALMAVDYGASEGANSVKPLKLILDRLALTMASDFETTASVRDVYFSLCDTPSNDYCTLARTLHQAAHLWSQRYPKFRILPAMLPLGYFRQIVPSNTVHVGYSLSCLQWLSAAPAHEYLKHGERDRMSVHLTARHDRCKQQAAEDLRLFLDLRAKEFKSGGNLLISLVAKEDSCGYWDAAIFRSLVAALEEMVKDGKLPRSTADSFYPPVYARTVAEIQEVLREPRMQEHWTLVKLTEDIVEHPASEEFHSTETNSKMKEYAEKMVDFGLAIKGNCLRSVLRKSTDEDWDDLLAAWRSYATNIYVEELSNQGEARVKFKWVFMLLQRNVRSDECVLDAFQPKAQSTRVSFPEAPINH